MWRNPRDDANNKRIRCKKMTGGFDVSESRTLNFSPEDLVLPPSYHLFVLYSTLWMSLFSWHDPQWNAFSNQVHQSNHQIDRWAATTQSFDQSYSPSSRVIINYLLVIVSRQRWKHKHTRSYWAPGGKVLRVSWREMYWMSMREPRTDPNADRFLRV